MGSIAVICALVHAAVGTAPTGLADAKGDVKEGVNVPDAGTVGVAHCGRVVCHSIASQCRVTERAHPSSVAVARAIVAGSVVIAVVHTFEDHWAVFRRRRRAVGTRVSVRARTQILPQAQAVTAAR